MSLTLVQKNGKSGTGVSSLNILVSATGAGNLLVITAGSTNGTSGQISSVTGGGTWTVDTNFHTSSGTTFGSTNVVYCLSAPSGVTSFTVNFSASNTWRIEIYEYSFTGSSIAYDTSASVTRSGSATPVGVSLTLAGLNSVVVRCLESAVASITSISSPYTLEATDTGAGSVVGHADVLNITSDTAPTWTMPSSTTVIEGAIAFKEAAAAFSADEDFFAPSIIPIPDLPVSVW